jgi:hypothetical protein
MPRAEPRVKDTVVVKRATTVRIGRFVRCHGLESATADCTLDAAKRTASARRPRWNARPDGGTAVMSTLESSWLLAELEPTVTQNLDRHLGAAKEWMPHEFVPWKQGAGFRRSRR